MWIRCPCYGLYAFPLGTSGGVTVSKQARLANLHEWVRVSLGAPFIWPCATSKQRALWISISFSIYFFTHTCTHTHTHNTYIYILAKRLECSPIARETWVQSRVESYQRLKKMVLDASLLNTQHYKVRFKGKVEQSREWSSALPYTLV